MDRIDYYFSPASPWAYLGHERLADMGQRFGLAVRVMPVDLAGTIFPATGGAAPSERPLSRRIYRLLELERFSRHLSIPLNIHPAFFPVRSDRAARMIVAVNRVHGEIAATRLTGLVLAAVWRDEKDIASEQTLRELLREAGVSTEDVDIDHTDVVEAYQDNTHRAIQAGVFGSPSYVFAGELFFGQDRLDHLEAAIVRVIRQSNGLS